MRLDRNLQRVVVDCFADTRAFNLIVDGLRDGLEHRMTPAAYQQVKVTVATAEDRGAVLGAVDLVLERHLGRWVGTMPLVAPAQGMVAAARSNGRNGN